MNVFDFLRRPAVARWRLQQSIVPAFIAAIFKPRLDQRERNSLSKMSGVVFLKWCRQTRSPSCPSSPGHIPDGDEDDSDTFELYRDLGWHGHAIFKLTGSRVALLNPLFLLFMIVFIVGVSSARFAITLCTPPAPGLTKCFFNVYFWLWCMPVLANCDVCMISTADHVYQPTQFCLKLFGMYMTPVVENHMSPLFQILLDAHCCCCRCCDPSSCYRRS